MSEQKPKTITLRRLGSDEMVRDGDFYMSTDGPDAGEAYREVSPIPEGYEPCDLEGATKVLIGETWCEIMNITNGRAAQIGNSKIVLLEHLETLGVLAIRPIPGPEPMRGETRAGQLIVSGRPDSAVLYLPKHLIGEWIRWEVVKDGGE